MIDLKKEYRIEHMGVKDVIKVNQKIGKKLYKKCEIYKTHIAEFH